MIEKLLPTILGVAYNWQWAYEMRQIDIVFTGILRQVRQISVRLRQISAFVEKNIHAIVKFVDHAINPCLLLV